MTTEHQTGTTHAPPEGKSSPGASEELLGPLQGNRLEELLERARKTELKTLPGGTVKRSRFTLKQMSKDSPLKRKRKKPRQRKDSYRRKDALKHRRLRAAWLLDCDKCYRYYRTLFGDRWKISAEEWRSIWEEYGLEGLSPAVSPLTKGDLTIYSIVIKPSQEKKLPRSAVYDGEERKLYDLMYI